MIGSGLIILFTVLQITLCDLPPASHTLFPEGFLFGAGTSSYQVEGGWNADGKGESIWDRLVHTQPSVITSNGTGDIACDSYHKYKEDVQLLKEIGFKLYRFSLSWPRIFPKGTPDLVNQAGIDYYNNLINELLANEIQPMVTIYHWDLPQTLQDDGGWLNPSIITHFEKYADFVYKTFGDRVQFWTTINEFYNICAGYGTTDWAPVIDYHGHGEYISCHNAIKAHAKAYRVYEKKYKKIQKGWIGFSEFYHALVPKDPSNPDDVEASERYFQFQLGRVAHPIVKGDYPPLMREIIDRNSKNEGLEQSRLPVFTKNEINEIKGTCDFFAYNHYTTYYATLGNQYARIPSWDYDVNVSRSSDPSWKRVSWINIVPQGLRIAINQIEKEYDNIPILIAESGLPDDDVGNLNDKTRVEYYESYLAELRDAIYKDGANVFGFVAWSLMDNFEWMHGYSYKFGIVQVDFDSEQRTRTLKNSARWLKDYIHMHRYQ